MVHIKKKSCSFLFLVVLCSIVNYFLTVFRALAEQLERVDMSMLETKAKLAFWINVYNSLIMHVSAGHLGFGDLRVI